MGYKPESASPFDLWTLCKNRYGSKAHDKHTISLLSKEWLTLSMDKVGGSRNLLMKVTSLAAELERVGQTMSEIMIVERTLQAWKERYPNDEVILRDSWETGNRTKDEVFAKILQKAEEEDTEAFLAQQERQEKRKTDSRSSSRSNSKDRGEEKIFSPRTANKRGRAERAIQ
jgi:hypothetical protein